MRVLIIGGTGLISKGITKQLLAKGEAEVVHFNRGSREAPEGVGTIVGDRRMPRGISRLRSFVRRKRTAILGYAVTAVGNWLYLMKRLRERRPIIVHGDGSSLWVACHRDDVARAFVNAIGNPAAYGQCYQTTGEEWMTHDRYWRTIAAALGADEPVLVHMPTDLLKQVLPNRADWCHVNFRHPAIFDNAKAKRDLGFRYSISWAQGIADVIRRLDERGLIRQAAEEPYYDALLSAWEEAIAAIKNRLAGHDS